MHPPLSLPSHRIPRTEALAIAPGIRFDSGGIRLLASRESSRSLFWLERRGGAA
jgi:hypothetical protein